VSKKWWDGALSFCNGYAWVWNGEKWYVIDTEGNVSECW